MDSAPRLESVSFCVFRHLLWSWPQGQTPERGLCAARKLGGALAVSCGSTPSPKAADPTRQPASGWRSRPASLPAQGSPVGSPWGPRPSRSPVVVTAPTFVTAKCRAPPPRGRLGRGSGRPRGPSSMLPPAGPRCPAGRPAVQPRHRLGAPQPPSARRPPPTGTGVHAERWGPVHAAPAPSAGRTGKSSARAGPQAARGHHTPLRPRWTGAHVAGPRAQLLLRLRRGPSLGLGWAVRTPSEPSRSGPEAVGGGPSGPSAAWAPSPGFLVPAPGLCASGSRHHRPHFASAAASRPR